MGEPDIDQPLSPVVSVGMVTYMSTPSSSISDMNMDSESEKRAQTPMKCMGHLYYGQQHKTPCMSSPSWLGLTQSSPCIKTPGSSSSGNRMKSLANHHTPSSKNSSRKGTPHMHTPDQPYNPFDSNLLEQLEGSLFSPNVFAEVQSIHQTPKSFQWTIDELAILKPADIDELPNQPNAIPPQADSDLEKRAQEVIDAYFANNLIAPSPWSLNGPKKNFVLPETPKTPASINSADSPLTFGDSKTPAAEKKTISSQCDAACQTALTLPVNFDIEKVLGEYVTHKTERTSDDQDILSMSSLRRKLFFHGEDSSLPSPVKSHELTDGKPMECNPSLVSPIKEVHQTPKQSRFTLTETPSPSSSHFSSSPISLSHSNALTPFLRQCSTAANLIESPGFSPIISSSSPHSHVVTPTSRPLQATPVMRSLESPGMSPIVEPNDSFPAEPTRKLRMSRLRLRPEKMVIPDELRPSMEKRNENESSFLDMDVERDHSPQHNVDDLSFVSSQEDRFMKPNHFSLSNVQYSDDELSNQDTMQTYYISQDTGYNTNSLQLTNNQMTGMHSGMTVQSDTSLHTNLTHQFVGLPFSGDGHQSADGSTMLFTKQEPKKAFVRHLAQKPITDKHENCQHRGDSELLLNDREVRRKAKRILGKSISMDDSQLGTSLDVSKRRPYLLNAIGVPAVIMSSPKSSYRKQYITGEKILPSELASQMLHKAGEDFRKYCDEHLCDKYDGKKDVETEFNHVPMDSESHQNICISTSAEF